MLTAQRKQIILEKLRLTGQVSVIALSNEWGISEDSVRRDLRDLAEEGLVQRVHGGALPKSTALGDYEKRKSISTDIKARLGRLATSLIRGGQVIALDGGTTNLHIARSLPKNLACTVVTHSPIIAAELKNHENIEIILIGGKIFRHSQVAVGSQTIEAISRIRTDLFFLGATGIHPETGVTTGDWEEATVKRAFCQNSAETILLVSPEKWGAAAPFQIIKMQELSMLIIDTQTTEIALEPYQRLGLEILRG